MTTTNKAFNYNFNTSAEDHKISKILSGHDADATVALQKMKVFDSQTRTKIDAAQHLLFVACQNLEATTHNVNQPVIDVLTACVLRHYPLLKELNPDDPAIKRVEACVFHSDSSLADLLNWSPHLVSAASTCDKIDDNTQEHATSRATKKTEESGEQKTIRHQAAVANHLIEHAQRQDQRMDALEAKLNNQNQDNADEEASKPKKKQRRSSVTHLHAPWFAWYAQEPRMWQSAISKQQTSNAKLLVAFVKLFLDDGFELDTTAQGYRDRVLDLGKRAEEAVLAFLAERKITSRGSGAVLKHLRTLHRSGGLNAKI